MQNQDQIATREVAFHDGSDEEVPLKRTRETAPFEDSDYSCSEEFVIHGKAQQTRATAKGDTREDRRRERVRALYEDKDYLMSVSSQNLFLEYLSVRDIGIYEFLRECNREGVTVDRKINKYFNIKENPIKQYTPYESQYIIHQQNHTQRNLLLIENNNKKEFRKVRRSDYKQIHSHIEIITDLKKKQEQEKIEIERKTQRKLILQNKNMRLIRQLRQCNHVKIEETHHEKYNYTKEPLDVPLQENLIPESVSQFQKFYSQMLDDFKEVIPKPEPDTEAYVDYHDMSDDSIQEYFVPHPKLRDPQYRTMNFYVTAQIIPIQSKIITTTR